MTHILDGIRVLDLSRILAGPWAAQMLADLGAEVIKVERPGGGDDTRRWGPPFLKDESGRDTTEAAYYLAANRGKKSLTLDLKHPRGQAIARAIALESDVVIENFKVGDLARSGLDYATLSRDHPGLVYCSITGFGQDGPYADRPGYDFMIQGTGGLMSVTGEPDGEPQKAGVALADLFTGLMASNAILGALYRRALDGQGQYIDLGLLDVQVAMLANLGLSYLTSGQVPKRQGNAHQTIVPYQVFATADGHVIVAVGNDSQYRNFCAAVGLPALGSDERFATNPSRVRHRELLVPLLAEAMRAKGSADWLAALDAAGVPCGPINALDKVFADPQVRSRGMVVETAHPLAGRVRTIGNPIRYSRTPVEYQGAPPLLGEHNGEVLAGVLGLDAAEIAALQSEGVI
jgi:crotonobetainyl-CoA:carnitine CoA-transferase CaiB-like acyl-CoA transferase